MTRLTDPRRFVALDRDGTLIALKHYLSDPDDVQLLPAAAPALRRLRALGLGLIVITNQSAVGRGIITEAQLGQIHARLDEQLAAEGLALDGVYSCPHAPDHGCECRKPRPGMLLKAAKQLHFEPGRCFVVGDNVADIELGQHVGAATFLVRTGYGAEIEAAGAVKPDFVVDDLLEASERIERLLNAAPIREAAR